MAQKVYIYLCLVTNSDIPKCLDKWSKDLNIEIDVNEIFDIKLFLKTTNASDGLYIYIYYSPLGIFYV